MTISTTSNFDESFERSDLEPRFLVSITDGVTTWKATSGSMQPYSDLLRIPEAIQKVSPVSTSIDPFTREFSIDEAFVDIDYDWMHHIIAGNILKGKHCEITLGSPWLHENEFVDYFAGTIEGVQIDKANGKVSLSVLTILALMRDNKIVGYWRDKHPIEAIYDGTNGVLDK